MPNVGFGSKLDLLRSGERILEPDRQWILVLLSFAVSWLGAYTTCQILSHANSVGRGGSWLAWISIASLIFGFVSIWCLHFLAVLSCSLDVRVDLNIPLTFFSAVVATFFTFVAFSSDSSGSRAHGWLYRLMKSSWTKAYFKKHRRHRHTHRRVDEPEDEEVLIDHRRQSDEMSTSDIQEQHYRPVVTSREDIDAMERGRRIAGEEPIDENVLRAAGLQEQDEDEEEEEEDEEVESDSLSSFTQGKASRSSPALGWEASSGASTPVEVEFQRPLLSGGRRTSSSSGTYTATSDSSDQDFRTSDDNAMALSLNRIAKRRLMSGAYRAPLSFKAFLKEIYRGFSAFVALKGFVWAIALLGMHHLGIAAARIPQGRVHFDPAFSVLAASIAFIVTSCACICIRNMETQASRQLLFSTVAASGVFAFHYTSVAGATYISAAPPDPDPMARGYPPELPFIIVVGAILSCVLTSGMLAHNATLSRNRLAELVLTKRRMWRVIAEKEAVDRAAEVKQQFISVASHELRTPLFSVTGYAELLSRTNLTDEQSLYIQNVLSACSSMNLIISNVLDFSKLERGNAESSAKPVRVNIRIMLEGLVRMTEDRGINSGFAGVDLIVAVAENVPETILVDEAYVTRVLMNLLSNSLKFTQRGYILVQVTMEGGLLVINVIDSGSGIPKRFRKSLFEPYRQADNSLTRPHQGTGLGLSICKQLVQRLSGAIDVSSVEGEGTTFTVTLPCSDPSPPPLSDRPNGSISTKRILIACRHSSTESTISSILRSYGFTVSLVRDTTSTADIITSADIVWCDAESLCGLQILQQLFQTDIRHPTIPLVVTTSGFSLDSCEGFDNALNTVLVRGPGIVLHRILEMFKNLSAHYRTPTPAVHTKVLRFAELPSKVSESSPAPPLHHKGCVMLVEDNAVNRALGKRILEKMDYDTLIAENGEEAIALAKQERAEVILMDCQMPVLDGHGATRAIREMESKGILKRRTWIIALTANVTRAAEERCKEDGFDLFLPKPLNLAQLKEALDRYISPADTQINT